MTCVMIALYGDHHIMSTHGRTPVAYSRLRLLELEIG
jgi:hypothetical protein